MTERIRDPYPDDIERIVLDARNAAPLVPGCVVARDARETERILARWVLEARAAREARQVRGEDDPGEAAREQARTAGNAHRRRILNALLAAWDAHPDTPLGELLAMTHGGGHIWQVDDAKILAGLRALVEKP